MVGSYFTTAVEKATSALIADRNWEHPRRRYVLRDCLFLKQLVETIGFSFALQEIHFERKDERETRQVRATLLINIGQSERKKIGQRKVRQGQARIYKWGFICTWEQRMKPTWHMA